MCVYCQESDRCECIVLPMYYVMVKHCAIRYSVGFILCLPWCDQICSHSYLQPDVTSILTYNFKTCSSSARCGLERRERLVRIFIRPCNGLKFLVRPCEVDSSILMMIKVMNNDATNTVDHLSGCLTEIETWVNANRLQLNLATTQVMWLVSSLPDSTSPQYPSFYHVSKSRRHLVASIW